MKGVTHHITLSCSYPNSLKVCPRVVSGNPDVISAGHETAGMHLVILQAE